jgi:hypothetical protein
MTMLPPLVGPVGPHEAQRQWLESALTPCRAYARSREWDRERGGFPTRTWTIKVSSRLQRKISSSGVGFSGFLQL